MKLASQISDANALPSFALFEALQAAELPIGFCGRGLLFEGGLGSGEAGNGNAEGRATHVIEADAMAEFYAVGVAAVFATNAELDVSASLLAFLDGDLHELANAALVNGSEGILFEDLFLL